MVNSDVYSYGLYHVGNSICDFVAKSFINNTNDNNNNQNNMIIRNVDVLLGCNFLFIKCNNKIVTNTVRSFIKDTISNDVIQQYTDDKHIFHSVVHDIRFSINYILSNSCLHMYIKVLIQIISNNLQIYYTLNKQCKVYNIRVCRCGQILNSSHFLRCKVLIEFRTKILGSTYDNILKLLNVDHGLNGISNIVLYRITLGLFNEREFKLIKNPNIFSIFFDSIYKSFLFAINK